MIEKLSDKQIEEVLTTQVVGRIGCHSDGLTYIVPISYVYDGRYVYGITVEGLKLKIMRKNPSICFQVDSFKDISNWKSVIAWGEFEELNGEERDRAIDFLMERTVALIASVITHANPTWPFIKKSSINGIIFRIELKNKTGRFESGQSFPVMLSDQS